jgi:hypothetical protein
MFLRFFFLSIFLFFLYFILFFLFSPFYFHLPLVVPVFTRLPADALLEGMGMKVLKSYAWLSQRIQPTETGLFSCPMMGLTLQQLHDRYEAAVATT